MEHYFWGIALRFVQLLIFSAPWVAAGFVTAGVFRVFVGPQRTRDLFGGNSWKGLVLGWIWGMLLPVCSLGVIPVVRELHRAGVRNGTLVAFALTAPLFNPLSVLYGLTLSDPLAIVTFAFCSLIMVTAVGAIFDRICPCGKNDSPVVDRPVDFGIKRVVAFMRASTVGLFGIATAFIAIGIAGSAAMSVALPHGSMSTMLEHDNKFAPILVAATGTPIYSTPLLAMSQIGSMFQHGNSIGAAFSLLVFGAGINLGLLAWMAGTLGFRKALAFMVLFSAVTLPLAYAVSEPLYPKGVEVAGHTHAFDVYTNPFHPRESGLASRTLHEIGKFWGENELGGTPLLLLMIAVGAIFIVLEKKTRLVGWIEAPAQLASFDRILPTKVIAVVSVLLLVASSVAGCYIFYPDKRMTLADMTAYNTEAVLAARLGQWEGAMKWIGFQEDLARRLEVGTFIRSGELSEYHRTRARLFREQLELLKHEIEHQDREKATVEAMKTSLAFRRMKRAFLDE
jgi:uncharacterized protein